jgi:hypothetical protein
MEQYSIPRFIMKLFQCIGAFESVEVGVDWSILNVPLSAAEGSEEDDVKGA